MKTRYLSRMLTNMQRHNIQLVSKHYSQTSTGKLKYVNQIEFEQKIRAEHRKKLLLLSDILIGNKKQEQNYNIISRQMSGFIFGSQKYEKKQLSFTEQDYPSKTDFL